MISILVRFFLIFILFLFIRWLIRFYLTFRAIQQKQQERFKTGQQSSPGTGRRNRDKGTIEAEYRVISDDE